MATKRFIPVLLALAVGCATGGVVRDIVVPARAQGQRGPTYEYWQADNNAGVLEKAGREGWHLAAAVPVTADGVTVSTRLFFERQLPR
jgi:hypothetical protein